MAHKTCVIDPVSSCSPSSPPALILSLGETLCLMCLQAPKMANSHFCSQTCIDDAESKGPMILEVPAGHVTFKSGSCHSLSSTFSGTSLQNEDSNRSIQGIVEARRNGLPTCETRVQDPHSRCIPCGIQHLQVRTIPCFF